MNFWLSIRWPAPARNAGNAGRGGAAAYDGHQGGVPTGVPTACQPVPTAMVSYVPTPILGLARHSVCTPVSWHAVGTLWPAEFLSQPGAPLGCLCLGSKMASAVEDG